MQPMFEAKLYVVNTKGINLKKDHLQNYYFLNKLKALQKCYELAKKYRKNIKYTGKVFYFIDCMIIEVSEQKVIL